MQLILTSVLLIFTVADIVDKIIEYILNSFKGANFWIVLICLIASWVVWQLIGTTRKPDRRVLLKQIGALLLIVVLAGGAMWVNYFFFQRERGFSKNVTGVLVTRIVGDDARDPLQGDLVGKLNAELQKEETGQQIEVHASNEIVNEN